MLKHHLIKPTGDLKKLLLHILVLLAFNLNAFASGAFTVSGKVTGENGEPLAGVYVFEVGVNNYVQTNVRGEYAITIQHGVAIIRFSFSGYEMQEIKAAFSFTKDISLKIAVAQNPAGVTRTAYKRAITESDLNGTGPSPIKVANTKLGVENPFKKTLEIPVSSFFVDVDGPSYSNIARIAKLGELPSQKWVRIEEMINYFYYDYNPPPTNGQHPFSIYTELGQCPWNKQHQLMLIGLQGKQVDTGSLPRANLVFLVDVSGSMEDAVKLPLVKSALTLLTQQLRGQDIVSVVTYAGTAKLALPATSGNDKAIIENAVESLTPGGFTAGSKGIKLAFKTARENFIKGGNNRIILCTDGDFNVGITSDKAIDSLIQEERKSGVFLSVLGFGTGKQQNIKMKRWAEIGNGNHNFIDGLNDARRFIANEFAGTQYTIAKDMRPLVRFNPSKVAAYRLIGYDTRPATKTTGENMPLDDAGELGNGHTVTALYEIIPPGIKDKFLDAAYAKKFEAVVATDVGENNFANIELRYKTPIEGADKAMILDVKAENILLPQTTDNFRFAASVAELGLLLRDSKYKQKASYKDVVSLAKSAAGDFANRNEFVTLAKNMRQLAKQMR